jgi:4-hydroxy-tetrahydrodipicolinate synthase
MFKGSIVALATPFTEDNKIDVAALHELIEWHIDSSTDALVLCGVTGEAATLSNEETLQIFKEAKLAAKGRIPLIAGTGSNNTQHALYLTQEAQNIGMDAAMVLFPYCNRPTPEGCFQHFQALSQLGFPLIAYHHPGRTSIKLPVKALARICELPHIVAVKEGTGELDYLIELTRETDIPILSGDDPLLLPMMVSGAVGIISVVANLIPREWKTLTTLLLHDQIQEARELFRRYYPLAKVMFLETNPQCVKYALEVMGKCSGRLRLPLIEPQETAKHQIYQALINAKLNFVLTEKEQAQIEASL